MSLGDHERRRKYITAMDVFDDPLKVQVYANPNN